MSGQTRTPRVLLADDEPHVRTYFKMLMGDLKFEVAGEACNGEEAVRRYRELKPDLLVLDLNMPLKTGEEALQEIVGEFPGAVVVVLSSKADRQTIERCIELGASNYIRKDTSADDTVAIIRETLGLAPPGGPP